MSTNTLTTKQKTTLVKDLIKFSKYQAGIKIGLTYKKKRSLLSTVDRILKEVRQDPKKFKISDEVLEMIGTSLKERNVVKVSKMGQETPESPEDGLDKLTIKQLAQVGTHQALVLINKKLKMLYKSKSKLGKESLTGLAKTMGILFDKRQISRGEATEFISMQARIENLDKMSNEDKLTLLLNTRQKNLESKV